MIDGRTCDGVAPDRVLCLVRTCRINALQLQHSYSVDACCYCYLAIGTNVNQSTEYSTGAGTIIDTRRVVCRRDGDWASTGVRFLCLILLTD